mmetsp:Transcript_124643/g.352854  ORF Transcript_124643/g.352854 Transcript_124643/m.352854 type:complete len:91 (+) Transcript_124643:192-464(+)
MTVARRLARLMDASTSRELSGSSALVGSSRKSSSGSLRKARARAIRCFCPPESDVPTVVLRPSGSCWMNSKAFASLAALRIFSSVAPGSP